jgi:hypothetical protein
MAIELAVAVLAFGGLALGLSGPHVSRAEVKTETDEDLARQVTVFGLIASPGSKTTDSKLVRIKAQLDTLMPQHGFRLLDAQSHRIGAGEAITCELGNGYTVETLLIQPLDSSGKIQLRCELFLNQVRQFSTVVKVPLNQLFFCQRALQDGTQLLIGIGAR